MDESYLTVSEVAELLRLNQQTVRNIIDRGELHAVRVGPRRVRIRQSDLDAFLAESSSQMGPTEQEARAAFAHALAAVDAADGNRELARALRGTGDGGHEASPGVATVLAPRAPVLP